MRADVDRSTARDRPPEEAAEDTSFARGLRVLLTIADRGYVLSTGRVVLEGRAKDLLEDEDLRKAYLGR